MLQFNCYITDQWGLHRFSVLQTMETLIYIVYAYVSLNSKKR